MTSIVSIKKDVEQLKRRITPSKPKSFIHGFLCDRAKPHSQYGHCIIYHDNTGILLDKQEAISLEDDLAILKMQYDRLQPYCKRAFKNYSWASFEKYKGYMKCKCGRFGHTPES